jgi:hypothetical protein
MHREPLEELTMPVQAIATELRPLRLNFAQVCIYCFEQFCQAPQCVASHARSVWMTCPECIGTLIDTAGLPCGCLYGLVEATPAAIRAQQQPESPVEVVRVPERTALPRKSAFCVWCLGPLDSPHGHDGCRAALGLATWTPCLTCLGGGYIVDGRECPDCGGVGFRDASAAVVA